MGAAAVRVGDPDLGIAGAADEKARCAPSADHAGEMVVPPGEGKLTMRPSTSEYMRIVQPVLPSEAKATRLLSGEMCGESETSPRWVTGCSPWPS